ncbi:hypothetical protein M426DRAFT_319603 [Hypoxylon sp. CI-4A]|nr:hypothetical protein M426DRAFT_319603 [Hypoxylon sp. CI-4A]
MAKHDYPYKKKVNVTAWVIQGIACIVLIAASVWALWVVHRSDRYAKYSTLFVIAAGLQIGITATNIVMNLIEIILIAKKRMPPWLYLSSACIKTTVWGVVFVLDAIAMNVVGAVVTLALLLTSILQLTHGAVLVHRKRRGTLKGGSYARAENPTMGFMEEGVYDGGGGGLPEDGAFYRQPNRSTEYKSPVHSPMPPSSPSLPQYGYSATAYAPANSYELDSRARNF